MTNVSYKKKKRDIPRKCSGVIKPATKPNGTNGESPKANLRTHKQFCL